MASRDPRQTRSGASSSRSGSASSTTSGSGLKAALYGAHDRFVSSKLARSTSARIDRIVGWLTRGSRLEHSPSEFSGRATSSRSASSRSGRATSSRTARSDRSSRSGRSGRTPASTARVREDYSGWRFIFSPLASYWALTSSVVVLTLLGLIMVFSSRTAELGASSASVFSIFARQSGFAVAGFAFFAGVQFLKPSAIRKYSTIAMLGALFLQALTLTSLGSSAGGNAGWLVLGPIRFQPAEALKFALAIWLPHVLIAGRKQAQKVGMHRLDIRPYILPILGFGLALGLVILGKDLGTAIVVVFIGVAALFIAGFPLTYLLTGAGAGGLLLFLVLVRGSSNRWDRIMAAYGGCSTRQAAQSDQLCFQTLHGDYALATGGITGVGLGNSREKSYLPAQDNDFIFAIIGEELGFIGALAVIICIAVMAWAIINLSLRHQSVYMQMVLVCFGVWFTAQSLINLSVVLGLLPVMGLPLPFISAGGSSLIMCLAGAGVCVRFAREQEDVRASRGR